MADEEAANQTYFARLKAGEQHVFWKLGFRVAIIILDIIAIGTAAYILTQALSFRANPYTGFFSGPEVAPGTLIVAPISLIFCLVCILVLLLRRPPRPAHPGIAVGCDLVLWLAFLVTALFTTAAIFATASFGNDRTYLEDPSDYNGEYSGNYYLAPNNTWVYNITSVYADSDSGYGYGYGSSYGGYFWNATRDAYQKNTTRPTVHRDCSQYFASCVQQDAYVNELWHSKSTRLGTEIAAAAAQWLTLLFHFVLFVWACVDTHRWNRAGRRRKEGEVAERVIRDMQARGLITVHGSAQVPEGQPLMAENRDGVESGVGSVSRNESAEVGPSVRR